MNIGKFSFNEIIKMSFEPVKIKFAFWGLFAAIFCSVLFNYGLKFVEAGSILANILSWTGNIATILLVFVVLQGICIQIKNKNKKIKLGKEIGIVFWKMIGANLLYLTSIVLILSLLVLIGLCGKIPIVGPYGMALIAVPMIAFLAFLVMYLAISGKFIFVALAEKPKAKVFDLLKQILLLTKNNLKKITFNTVLLFFPLFTLLIGLAVVLSIAYVLYVAFCWVVPGLKSILVFSMNMEPNLISLIILVSGGIIFTYVLAQIVVMQTIAIYSIYLDAE